MAVDPLLTSEGVGELLNRPTSAVDQMRYRGVGPKFLKLDSQTVRYRLSDVEAWLVTCERIRSDRFNRN